MLRAKTILTEEYGRDLLEQGKRWWIVRTWVIAHEKGKEVGPIDLNLKMYLRRN